MSRIVGIDLGTTNSLVATVDSGIPLVIADAQGRRLTPSVVHFPSATGDTIVGAEAGRLRVLKPAETVYSVKRFMGRRSAEIIRSVPPATARSPFPRMAGTGCPRRCPPRCSRK